MACLCVTQDQLAFFAKVAIIKSEWGWEHHQHLNHKRAYIKVCYIMCLNITAELCGFNWCHYHISNNFSQTMFYLIYHSLCDAILMWGVWWHKLPFNLKISSLIFKILLFSLKHLISSFWDRIKLVALSEINFLEKPFLARHLFIACMTLAVLMSVTSSRCRHLLAKSIKTKI